MTQPTNTNFPRTIGMDLGVKTCAFCVADSTGERVLEDTLKTARPEMIAFLEAQPASRLVIEACTPSRWVAEVAESLGHEVIVANPKEFRLIAESHRKTDRNDARILADFGQFRPQLLHPVRLRGLRCHLARVTLRARPQLVRQRTRLICLIRAQVRGLGESLPSGAPSAFHKAMKDRVPDELRQILAPLFDVLESIASAIAVYDKEIERLCDQEFPETRLVRQVNGVGPNTALAFVTTVEDPGRFQRSRDVGAYVGLVSKSRDSGDSNPELRISKCGDGDLRRLLVNSATYIIGPWGQDSDLKRFGLHLRQRGGQAARSKARIAVARKLAVLLLRLWVTGEVYEPLRNADDQAA